MAIVFAIIGAGSAIASSSTAIDKLLSEKRIARHAKSAAMVKARNAFEKVRIRLPTRLNDYGDVFDGQTRELAKQAHEVLICCFCDPGQKSECRLAAWQMMLFCTTIIYYDELDKTLLFKAWRADLQHLTLDKSLLKKLTGHTIIKVGAVETMASARQSKAQMIEAVRERLNEVYGHMCVSAKEHFDTNSAIRPLFAQLAEMLQVIHAGDSALKAPLSMLLLVQSATTSKEFRDASLPEHLGRFLQELRLTYKKDCEAMRREWRKFLDIHDKDEVDFSLNKYYVDLEIVGGPKQRRTAVHSYADIFDDMAKPLDQQASRILLDGEAGVGKTTFTHRLVLDWARGAEHASSASISDAEWLWKRFYVIILIRLGEITPKTTYPEALSNLVSQSAVSNALLETLDKFEIQTRTLIVLDAYDEFQPRSPEFPSSVINGIISDKSFRHATVLITSRHDNALEDFIGKCSLFKRITLKGLKREAMLELAEKHAVLKPLLRAEKCGKNDPEGERSIIKVLQKPLIFFMAYAALPAVSADSQRSLELYDVFHAFVNHIVERYKLKHESEPLSKPIIDQAWYLLGMLECSACVGNALTPYADMEAMTAFHERMRLSQKLGYLWRSDEAHSSWHFPHKLFADYFLAYFLWKTYQRRGAVVLRCLEEAPERQGQAKISQETLYFCSAFDQAFALQLRASSAISEVPNWLQRQSLDESTFALVIPWFYRIDEFPLQELFGQKEWSSTRLAIHPQHRISEESNIEMCVKWFSETMPPDAAMKTLHLHEVFVNQSFGSLFRKIGDCALQIENVILEGCKFTTLGFEVLLDFLTSEPMQTRLETLTISGCDLLVEQQQKDGGRNRPNETKHNMQRLATLQLLQNQSTFTERMLCSYISVVAGGDGGGFPMLTNLAIATLTEPSLASAELSDESCHQLVRLIQQSKSLTTIDLSEASIPSKFKSDLADAFVSLDD